MFAEYIYIMVIWNGTERLNLFIKKRNFSLAAKELFISQPAVSQQMSMLEAHVL
jgi:hypothetical protein